VLTSRQKAEQARETRLHAEAKARAQADATRRRRVQEQKLADELIMHACDNDLPMLLRALSSGETECSLQRRPAAYDLRSYRGGTRRVYLPDRRRSERPRRRRLCVTAYPE
jgi:hypothetical protein